MRRRSHRERVEQVAELRPLLVRRDVEQREDLLLQLLLVDPEGAAGELDPVAHEIVCERGRAPGVDVEQPLARLGRPRERVVHRSPAVLVVVPLEHREIRHPEELPEALVDEPELAAEVEPQRAEHAGDHRPRVCAEQHRRPGV